MQYSVDTLGIEIARLQKVIRAFKANPNFNGQNEVPQERIAEFENHIRELKKAIGVLKEFVKTTNANTNTYTSRYIDPQNR